MMTNQKDNMNTQYITAEQARVNMLEAQGVNGAFKRKETDELLTKITEASKKGQSEITSANKLDIVIENRLRALGYQVKWTEGYGQRDPGYSTVIW
jgi:hypothetical protein